GLETVTADAEAKAQELRIIAPANGALDFGRIEVGATANGEIRLQNSGGTPAIVEAQAFPPLIVTPAHQTLRVEPGAIIAFGVSLKGEQTGGFQSEVRIAGAGDLIRVPVKVEVLPVKSTTPPEPLPPPSVTPSVTPSPKTPDPAPPQIDKRTASDSDIALQQKVLGYLRSNGLPVPKDKINPYLERVKQVSILDQTTSSITLTWKKPEIMPAKWDVEASEMVFSPTSKDVMKLWKTFKSWEPVDAGTDKIAIRLHTLPDAAKIEIRIMGVDREGKVSEPSAPIILETLPSWKFPSWFWNLLIAVALLVVVYYLVRIRRGDFSK
ncbi:MAG: hypothetical protein WCN98_10145, partial [Verrucomicrobiaceae bacterium]